MTERVHDQPPSDRDQRDALEKLQVRLRDTRAELERARHGETTPELEALRLEVKEATKRADAARARGDELQRAVDTAQRNVAALHSDLEDVRVLAKGRQRRAEDANEIRARREADEDETEEWENAAKRKERSRQDMIGAVVFGAIMLIAGLVWALLT